MMSYETYVSSVGWFFAGIVVREMPRIVLEKILMRTSPKVAGLPNGNGLPSATRREVREVFVDTLKIDVLPVISQQTEILKGIAETNSRMSEGIVKLVAIEEARRGRK